MKNRLMPVLDRVLSRKRSIIETVNGQLKNISRIEHSRHRSAANFLVNPVAGLVAYTYQDKKAIFESNVRESNAPTCF